MARASGAASPTNVPAAEFFHAPSRVHYRLYSENGAAWLSFKRAGDSAVHGERQLLYFIGSGHRGREIVERVLQFDPDLPQAKELERQLSAQPPTCNAR